MRRAGRSALVAALIVAGTFSGSPWIARAHHGHVDDPKDTRGPLDIRRVATSGKPLKPLWRPLTFKRWTAQGIWDRGYFVIHLDLRGDNFYEHFVLVGSNGRGMRAHLYRNRKNKPPVLLRRVSAWRKNNRTVSVRFAIDEYVGPRRAQYRWYVTSLWSGQNCPRVCIDRVPDRGAVREPLVPPEPDPGP